MKASSWRRAPAMPSGRTAILQAHQAHLAIINRLSTRHAHLAQLFEHVMPRRGSHETANDRDKHGTGRGKGGGKRARQGDGAGFRQQDDRTGNQQAAQHARHGAKGLGPSPPNGQNQHRKARRCAQRHGPKEKLQRIGRYRNRQPDPDKGQRDVEIIVGDLTRSIRNVAKLTTYFSIDGSENGLDLVDINGQTTILRFEDDKIGRRP